MKAQYGGTCADCGDWIEEGDEIVRDSYGEWVHASCADPAGATAEAKLAARARCLTCADLLVDGRCPNCDG